MEIVASNRLLLLPTSIYQKHNENYFSKVTFENYISHLKVTIETRYVTNDRIFTITL